MSIERIISKDFLVIPQGNGGVLLKFKDSPPTDSVSVTSAEVASLVASETAGLVAADAALSAAINVVSNAVSSEVSTREAASATLETHIETVSVAVASINSFLSGVSARSVGDVSTHGLQSVIDALSNRISAGGGTGSVTSQELSVVAAGLSGRIDTASALASTADVHASTASLAATSVDNRLNTVSVRSVLQSIQGLQSVVDTLSNLISDFVSALVLEVGERMSADGILSQNITNVSNKASALSVRISTISIAASAADAHASTASLAATSADGHANTVSARVVSVSAELGSLIQIASLAATSVDGRVNSINTFLSGISARSVGGVSTHGIQSVINALSNRISAIPGGGSANPYSYVSAGQAICAAVFTDISGLCVSVSAGGIYKLEGQVMFSCSAATGNSFTLVFPTMSVAAGQLRTPFLNPVPGTSVGYSAIAWGNFGTAGSGSALISANFAAGALFDLIIDGVMNVNTTGVIKVQARGSVATNTITITPGSYLKVFKIR